MADISDEQLREGLRELTGKDVGPVLPSTKPALIKKLMKLRDSKLSNRSEPRTPKQAVSTPSPSSLSFSYSSDEEGQLELNHDTAEKAKQARFAARNGGNGQRKKSVGTRKSVGGVGNIVAKSNVNVASSSSAGDAGTDILSKSGINGHEKPTASGRGATAFIPSEEQLRRLSSEEIQAQLFDHTGKRFPITDSTKGLHVKKLHKILKSGDSKPASATAGVGRNLYTLSLSQPSQSPTETQFSDSDEEDMDFELSPLPPSNASISIHRPEMVNQSVNTSSFLDITTPGIMEADDDQDGIELPSPSSSIISPSSDEEVTSSSHAKRKTSALPELPSRLPSPNLSSTRRSFIPSNVVPVNSQPMTYRKPVQPSPPRSVYARRPIRAASTNVELNQDGIPKPTGRFSSVTTHYSTMRTAGSHSSTPDYSTKYSTGGGAVINSKNPAKWDKIAKDADMMLRDKGKHFSYIYSKVLVIGLAVFLTFVLTSYLYLKVTAPVPLESVFKPPDVYLPLLEASDSHFTQCNLPAGCYTEGQLRESKNVVDVLRPYLSQHAGYFECKWDGYPYRKMSQSEAKFKMQEQYGNDAAHLWPTVLGLLMKNPHWNIKLTGESGAEIVERKDIWYLESVDSVKPWSCVITNAMSRIIFVIVAVAVIGLLGYFSYLYGLYRKRHLQQQEEQLYEFVEQITDLLEAQYKLSRENSSEKPYLAISHVRDSLISPAERKTKQRVWTRAVAYIKNSETRVREEIQQVQGEEFQVWRWLQSAGADTSVAVNTSGGRWQGSAIRSRARLTFKPKLCMKIRGMFDVYREVGTDWAMTIQDDILEKLGPDHGVVHIAVDQDSDENRVYVKFGTTSHAGKAYSSINGAYYAGQCIECKFIEPKNYHQRFPHAEYATIQIRPSNPQNASKGAGTSNMYPSLRAYR